jgi:hypothetical protein
MAESPINTGQPPKDTDPNKIIPDGEMLALARQRWDAARKWRAGKEDQWQRWYKLYRSHANRTNWPHSVNLFIPLIWSTVESFLPRLVVQKPTILVSGRGDEKIPAATYHRQLLDFQWQDLNLPMVIQDWVKEALVYGTAIIKVGWERREVTRMFRQVAADGSTVLEQEQEKFPVIDRPFVALVPLENFYPEPGAPDIENARFVCERSKMTWHELRDKGEALGWDKEAINALEDVQIGSRGDISTADTHLTEKETTFGGSDSEMAKQEAEIWEFEVIEYWEDSRYCVFVSEPETILVNEYNPFWHGKKPYLRIVDNSLPAEFHGVGEPEILESINIELNALHNLRLENVNRAVFQQWKVKIGSPITPNMTKFKPGGVLWVTSQDDIQPLHQSTPPMALYREEDGLRQWSQIASGANEAFQGVAGGAAPETATGASILAQAAASRVGMKFLQLSSLGLEPLGEMLIALNEQFISDENALQIVGPEGQVHQRLGPVELATNGALLDVKIDIGATDPVNKEVQLQSTMNFLQILMQLYGDPNHPVIQVLVRRITDLADINIDPELLAVQPDPANVEASGGQPGSSPAGGDAPDQRDALGVQDGG